MGGLGKAVLDTLERISSRGVGLVLVIGADGEIIWRNARSGVLFERRTGDPEISHRFPFLSVGNEEIFLSKTGQALDGLKPEPVDLPWGSGNGAKGTIRWEFIPVEDDSGSVGKAVVAFGRFPIGECQGSSNFSAVEERYRLLFENTGIGMMYIHSDTRLILVNRELEKMTGFSKAQLEEKMSWTELIPRLGDLDRMLKYHRLRRIDPSLAPEVYETSVRTREGVEREISIRVTMIPDTDFSLASLIDITDRKRVEESLRKSEEKYRTLVENLQDTLYRCDLEGNITFVSPSGAQLLGFDSTEELVGQNIARDRYFNPSDREALVSILREKGRVANHEVFLKRKDGTPMVVVTNSQLFHDHSGKVVGVVGIFSDVTQRKVAEKENHRLAEIVRHSRELVNLADLDGKMFFLNEAGMNMLGIDSEDIKNTSILDVIPDHLKEFVARGILPKILAGGDWEGELQYVNLKTRKLVDVQVLAFSIEDTGSDSGPIKRKFLANVSLDISLKKKAERALQEHEQRLRGITQNIPAVVYQFFATDAGEYGIDFFSNPAAGIFGLKSDLKGIFQEFLLHVHEEDRESFLASIRDSVKGCSNWDFRGRFVKDSGEVIWFHGHSTPTRKGDRLVFDGVILDVTDRMRAEETFRQSEDKFMKIFMTTPDCIVITRLSDGLFLDVNLGFEEIIGWKREEALQRTSLEMNLWVDPKDRDFLVKSLEESGEILHHETRLRRKDGRVLNVIYSARSIRIANEKCLIKIVQDFTGRKLMEEERRKLELQLFQSQKMEAIGRLAGGIAHDFNNILSAIVGYSELCLESMSDRPAEKGFLDQVLTAAHRARDLVRQILTFSRKGGPEKKPISVFPILKEVVKFMRASLPTTIEIRQKFEEGPGAILADPIQIHQVLMNLCTNAGHAMKEKGGILELGSRILPDGGIPLTGSQPLLCRCLELSVRDSGHGIPREYLNRIFEPYFSTKAHGEGSGLGLAVVHGIVKDHGGEVRVQSEVGKGTIFSIILPLIEDMSEDLLTETQEEVLKGKGERVLFVDDERMVSDFNRVMLETLGYEVVIETDPERAVEVFRKSSSGFDIVITDKTMPRMTGFDLAAQIRALRPDIPIIICSGLQEKEDQEKLAALGIRQYIAKPARISTISKALREELERK